MKEEIKNLIALALALIFLSLIVHKAFLVLTIIILFLILISEDFSLRVSSLWIRITSFIGGIISKAILIIIFFVVLVPVAFICRIAGGTTLRTKENNYSSMFIERVKKFESGDLEKPW